MLSIEGAHLPKHQNSWIHVPVRSNALQDEFLQNQYISLVRCDLEGCRIAFYETEDYTSCIVSHRRDESWPGNTVYFCCFGACFCALATMCILSKGSSLKIQTLHNCKKIPEDNRSQNYLACKVSRTPTMKPLFVQPGLFRVFPYVSGPLTLTSSACTLHFSCPTIVLYFRIIISLNAYTLYSIMI
jgi:hypothetical protein